MSVDFPKPTRWDPKKDTVEAALDPAVMREKERIEHIYANAGRLAAAGVTFALTSGGTGIDLAPGLKPGETLPLLPLAEQLMAARARIPTDDRHCQVGENSVDLPPRSWDLV